MERPDRLSATQELPERREPSWASVAPLMARWQMALFPHGRDSWHVVTSWLCLPETKQHSKRRVRFADLPAAIAALAARCEADCPQLGTDAGAGEGEAS